MEILINQQVYNSSKFKKLISCIFLDLVGYLSYLVPFFGEFTDVIWAPISAFLLAKFFKGTIGKIGGGVAFIEEILPGLDFVPTFTITWLYCNLINKKSAINKP